MKRVVIIAFVIVMMFVCFGGGNFTVNAATEGSTVLKGSYAIRTGGDIYYGIDKTLYKYNEDTKSIKKLYKFNDTIYKFLKYESYIYLTVGNDIYDNEIFRYNLTDGEVVSIVKDANYLGTLGLIDGKIYYIAKKNDKDTVVRVEDDGSQVDVVTDLGGYLETGLMTWNCYVWDNKLYYAKAGESKKDKDAYYYMTADGISVSITKDKYIDVFQNNVSDTVDYPEVGVRNMLFSSSTAEYNNIEYCYYSEYTKKKMYLLRVDNKNNYKKKRIYSVKNKTKKISGRSIIACNAFKGCVLIRESSTYKKKSKGYIGEIKYKLITDKGKLIKTLGTVKYKKYRYR